MKLLTIAVLALANSTATTPHQHHTHLWQLESYQYVYNRYGQEVKQCTWECSYDWNHGTHSTTTTGMSRYHCPHPRN